MKKRVGLPALLLLALLMTGCEKTSGVKPDEGDEDTEQPGNSGTSGGGGKLSSVEMVWVEGGSFTMGSPDTEIARNPDETRHEVTLTGFYIGKYEVTQKEWMEVMGTSPSMFKGDDLPVECVSWYMAVEYCNKRSAKEGLTPAYTIDKTNQDTNNTNRYDTLKWTVTLDKNANGYRLPTEAEWEYAARGGTMWNSPYQVYAGSNTEGAWREGNSGDTTHPVESKMPNNLGLYNMSGNVGEWCWDWYDWRPSGTQTDPTGPVSGSARVLRGGSWLYPAFLTRSACRSNGAPSDQNSTKGFRLVRSQ